MNDVQNINSSAPVKTNYEVSRQTEIEGEPITSSLLTQDALAFSYEGKDLKENEGEGSNLGSPLLGTEEEGSSSGAIMLGINQFLFSAEKDMIDQSSFLSKAYFELKASSAQVIGGIDAEGHAVLNSSGDPTYGLNGAVYNTSVNAYEKEAEQLRDQAQGQIIAGAASAASMGLGATAYLGGGNMTKDTAETANLKSFQTEYSTSVPAGSTNSASISAGKANMTEEAFTKEIDTIGKNKSDLNDFANKWAQAKRDSTPGTWTDNQFTNNWLTQRLGLVSNTRSETNLAKAQADFKKYDAQMQFLKGSEHGEKVKENADKLIENSGAANQRNSNLYTQRMDYIRMASDGARGIGQGYYTELEASAKAEAGKYHAQEQLLSTALKQIQDNESGFQGQAGSYYQQATQIAQGMAQVLRG